MKSPSKLERGLYYLGWPLGELQIQIMRLQDHAEVVIFLQSNHIDPNVKKIPQSIDWSKDLSAALAEQKLNTSSNPYGIDNSMWSLYQHKLDLPRPLKPGSRDEEFSPHVRNMEAWSDLQILLNVLQELGAKPLLLGRPMNVHLWEALGVSENAQNTYYTQLHAITDQYHMPLVDYQQYGTDIYFSIDQGAHTSGYGWVYVDQTLDEFFHGNIR